MGATRTVEASVGGEATTGRTEMWRGVIKAIERRPVFGHGEGQMREVAPYSIMTHPHNSILQVILAWGIVGLLCVIVLAIAFTRRALPPVRRSEDYMVPAFIGLVSLAVLSLVDNPLINPIPGSMFAAFAGIIASRWKSRPPESSSGPPG
jgi:O-antigen ligase